MDKIFLLNLEKTSKLKFLSILKDELNFKFNNNIDSNYSDTEAWSLLNLIQEDKIDCYQLIYVNNLLWVGSGGMIRMHNDKKIYQAGFRAFSNASMYNNAIGIKSYSHEYNTKYQISRAINAGCEDIVLSFNLHNEKLFRITRDYHLPKVFGEDVWKSSNEPIKFNGVEQWLLTMSLK
jgi:hypothetical protein